MHFLQRQLRLCSTTSARPLEKSLDYDENVKIVIPPSAYQTASTPIEHDPDNGHVFKVNTSFVSIQMTFLIIINPSTGIRFVCTIGWSSTIATEARCRRFGLWKNVHRSYVESLLAQKSWRVAKTGNHTNGKPCYTSSRQSIALRCRSKCASEMLVRQKSQLESFIGLSH